MWVATCGQKGPLELPSKQIHADYDPTWVVAAALLPVRNS
jgi:predicted small lipoprotein YifL